MNSLKYVQDEILIESDSSLQRVELMSHLKVQVQELICYVNVNFLSIMSSSGIASTETSIFFVFFDFSSNVAASFVLSQVCLILQNLLLCRPQSRRARHLVRVRLVYFYINVIVIPQFRLHSCLQPPLHPRF